MLKSPYADILAARAASKREARPVKLRPSLLDTGAPSTRATDARDERISASVRAVNERNAMLAARRDYRDVTGGYVPHPFHTYDRPTKCRAPNAGRDVTYA